MPTTTSSGSPVLASEASGESRPTRSGRWPSLLRTSLPEFSHGLLITCVVLFGAWTLCYQLALIVGAGVWPTALATLVLAGAVLVLLLRHRADDAAPRPAPLPAPALRVVGIAVLGTAAATVSALAWGHQVVAALLLLAGAAVAAVWVLRGARPAPDDDTQDGSAAIDAAANDAAPHDAAPTDAAQDDPRLRTGLWLSAWLSGLGVAVLATLIRRPDGDDVFFVNLTGYVARTGRFPLRDTMFGDQVWPMISSHSPPVHSWEGLLGFLAHATGVSGAFMTYVVAVPVLSLLAVLGLAWAIEESRLRAAPVGLLATVVWLLASGPNGYSFGNFFIVRIWQGKAAFALVVAPVLIVLAIRYCRRGGGRPLLLLLLATVCALGMTNTIVLLLPILLIGLVPAAWAYGGPRRAAGLLAPLTYVLAVGAAIVLLKPTPVVGAALAPTVETGAVVPAAAEPSLISQVLGNVPQDSDLHAPQLLTITLALAIGVGWLGLRDRTARLVAIGCGLAFAVFVTPPVLAAVQSATSAGAVLWRVWWILPVPLLVAGLVSLAAQLVPVRLGALPRIAVTVGVAAAVALLPLVGDGVWITSRTNLVEPSTPLAWKAVGHTQAQLEMIRDVARPGETVLAPWDVSRVISATGGEFYAVAPRISYLKANAADPAFDILGRDKMEDFADWADRGAATMGPLLEQHGVDLVCLRTDRLRAEQILEELGYHQVGEAAGLRCLRR